MYFHMQKNNTQKKKIETSQKHYASLVTKKFK